MTVDWTALRRRVEEAMAASDMVELDTDAAEVLEERARVLARRQEEAVSATDHELVELTMAGRPCAIEAMWVVAVLRPPELTPIPGAGPALVGIAKVRGAMLAVFDVASRVLGEPSVVGTESRIIALGHESPELGLVVDSVDRVTAFSRETLTPPPAGEAAGLVLGITQDGRPVLSGQALLADRRFFVDHTGVEPGG